MFDKSLANTLKVINPEYELGTTLPEIPKLGTTLIKEAKPGRSSLGISEQQKSEIVDKATEEGYTNVRKLDTAGGSIMAGVKNGKWYNVETGELIK